MSEHETTYLAPNTILKGELQLAGPATIAGRIEGAITGDNAVQVVGDGSVEGDIQGSLVEVQGTVKGNIIATQLCRLGATARVSGELRAANLAIVEGACFVGQVCVGGPSMEEELQQQMAAQQKSRQTAAARQTPVSPANVVHEMAAAANRLANMTSQTDEMAETASGVAGTVNVVSENIQNTLNRGPRIIRARS
ncbi:MAG TPA: polymer-forming cytoskeletal protein [Phycisphaerae bacterium]|nr:polymer-forming cytoskeletal protein [Phycisphaerae bacterium]